MILNFSESIVYISEVTTGWGGTKPYSSPWIYLWKLYWMRGYFEELAAEISKVCIWKWRKNNYNGKFKGEYFTNSKLLTLAEEAIAGELEFMEKEEDKEN